MKKVIAFIFVLAVGFALSIASCSNPPTTNEPTTIDTFKYHSDFITKFDQYEVSAPDSNGNNADQIIASSKVQVTENTITDTLTFEGKSNVIVIQSNSSKGNSVIYYHQETNGDLYRYNYGFDYLNSFSAVIDYLGGDSVKVGWVLVARLGGKEGDTWTAVRDTLESPNIGGKVYLESHGTAMADTSIMVLGSPVHCHHVRFVITAITSLATATEIADTYISPELGTTVSDFFRSVSIPSLGEKANGSYKIMTYHE